MKRMIKKIIVMTLSLVLVLINMSYVFAESEAASIRIRSPAKTAASRFFAAERGAFLSVFHRRIPATAMLMSRISTPEKVKYR